MNTTMDQPEYIRPSQAKQLFGISRSTLYLLINEGRIKSRCLRRKGNIRGARLVSVESIREYIESFSAE